MVVRPIRRRGNGSDRSNTSIQFPLIIYHLTNKISQIVDGVIGDACMP